jgi:hypothetical protein
MWDVVVVVEFYLYVYVYVDLVWCNMICMCM